MRGQLWCQSMAEVGRCNWYLPHCHCTPGLKDLAAPATLSFRPRWNEVCRWQRPRWPGGGVSGTGGSAHPGPNSQVLIPEIAPELVPPGWSSCLLARAVQWVGGRSGLAWWARRGCGQRGPCLNRALGPVHSVQCHRRKGWLHIRWGWGRPPLHGDNQKCLQSLPSVPWESDTPLPGENHRYKHTFNTSFWRIYWATLIKKSIGWEHQKLKWDKVNWSYVLCQDLISRVPFGLGEVL